MEYDFAVVYFGLTRSIKKTHQSHEDHVFNVFKTANMTYKTFVHTWKTRDDSQNVWTDTISQKIDYKEHELLRPDVYQLDDETEFLECVCMDNYFYKDVWNTIGHSGDGEWLPILVSNHVCMLESQKRGFQMVQSSVLNGDKYKFILFIRPDITIHNDLPLQNMISNNNNIHVPNRFHNEGINDQVAMMSYDRAHHYANRIDEMADYRKHNGRIVGEKYLKFIIDKYNLGMLEMEFDYEITRP
jgi:hypothetical protein